MTTLFEASWSRCWRGLGAAGDNRALMQSLHAAYDAPPRRYHTREHLGECLALFDRHRALAGQPDEVEMALWFHDAVYDLRARDNEERSADWARRELRQAGVAPERVARVAALILATRHAAPPAGDDAALTVDIDLAILGAERRRFEAYEAQVRAEYRWVPGPLFRRTRREVLAAFLARAPLYRTPALREAFEERAQENLARALRQLER